MVNYSVEPKRKTFYYCTNCDSSHKNSTKLTAVELVVRGRNTKELQTYPNAKLFLCEACLKDIGFDNENNKLVNPIEMIKRILKLIKERKGKR